MLPWRIQVRVFNLANHKMITVPLIDRGPAKPPHADAALDLTQSAFASLGGSKAIGHIRVNYRVLGGARYLSAGVRSSMARA
jgi:rare lipoprotein A (peptidoglycan hydrolase)